MLNFHQIKVFIFYFLAIFFVIFLVEVCYLTRDGDKTVLTQLNNDEIDQLITEHNEKESETLA